MRRVLRMICVLLAGLGTGRCGGQDGVEWLTWDGSPEGTPPEVEVVESDANSTSFEVLVHGFFLEEVEKETNQGTVTFARMRLPRDSMSDYGTIPTTGRAELPVIRPYIAVLSDAEEVEVARDAYEIDPESVSVLEEITVYPFQPFSSEEYPLLEFEIDERFYSSPMAYPLDYDSPPVLHFDVGLFHHLRVARVELYPFVFVPAERVVRVYRHFRVRVDHGGQESPELLPHSVTYERMYSGLLANYAQIKPLLPPGSDGAANYLIITPEEYSENIMPLAWWKRAKGLSVTIRTIPTQVLNGAGPIKSAIEKFYEEHSGNDVYVLLVGDVEDVAAPTCEAYEWNELKEDCCSDAQYARVAGEDLLPDLFLGRIPAESAEDVDNTVAKILAYEKMSTGGDNAWLDRALLVAHKQDHPGEYRQCKESIRTYSYSFATPNFDTAYGAEGATNADLRNALEAGRGFVNYRGHGGVDCWWTWGAGGQSWCVSPDVVNLPGGEATPIVFAIASLTNRIHKGDCLGEELTNVPRGGAVAYYGASADSGAAANESLDKNLFKAAFDEGIHPLGAVVNWAQVRTMEEVAGRHAFSSEYNADIYILLGDPEMGIRTRAPQSFGGVEYPEWVEAGEQVVSVVVTDADGQPVPGALVLVRKYKGDSASPDVEAKGYTQSDGTASFTISPTTRGGLSVTVLKQDYVPYEGDGALRVIHAEGDAASGDFTCSWQIEPGISYAVYATDELWPEPNWSLLGISPKKEGLTMTFTDTTAGLARQRFYRVQAR